MGNQIDDLSEALQSVTEQFFSKRLLAECKSYDLAVSRLYQGICAFLANSILNTHGDSPNDIIRLIHDYTERLVELADEGEVLPAIRGADGKGYH